MWGSLPKPSAMVAGVGSRKLLNEGMLQSNLSLDVGHALKYEASYCSPKGSFRPPEPLLLN